MKTEHHSLVVAVLLFPAGCADTSSRMPPAAFASPTAIFQQFQRSVESNQWRQASECLSRDAQLQLAVQLYSFALTQKPDDDAAFSELRQQHGISAEAEVAETQPPDAGDDAVLSIAHLSQVTDLPRLITDLSRLIEWHSDSESWKAMRSFSFLEPSLGAVRTEGDFAVAELLVPGVDLSPPILFERSGDKWQIVDLEGRNAQRCPETAFYHYCTAIQGRRWERLLPLLDPESQELMLVCANQLADAAADNDPESLQQLEPLKTRVEPGQPAKAAVQFASLMTFAEQRLQSKQALLAFPLSARLGEVTLTTQDEATAPVVTQESPEPVLTLAFRKLNKLWVLDIRQSN
jgi:hypothetical protein